MKIVSYPFIDIVQTPVGLMLVKATQTHIHEISFIEKEEVNAISIHASALTGAVKTQLEEYFSGERTHFDLPFSQEGTAFQQSVWEMLLQIPFGETTSYLQLAIKMGDEKTIRAVANANGKNKLALVIPCHRVIGSDGALTGYAWGLKRKQLLLDFEGKTSGKKLTLF
ncbi:MAG: methylated-DNA--[protein]-cysteine S-methyltransferase [Bacteroidota bacterium]